MNKCGDCSMCCDLPQIVELKKPENVLCEHYENGCKIYCDRPSECSGFNCSYLQSGAHIDLRPDNCGVMFEKLTNEIFHGTLRPGTELSDIAKGQIDLFVKQGYSVFIRNGDKTMRFLGVGHERQDIVHKFKVQMEILHGGS